MLDFAAMTDPEIPPPAPRRRRVRIPQIDLGDPTAPRPIDWKHSAASAGVSLLVHLALMLVLALVVFQVPDSPVLESVLSLVIGREPARDEPLEIIAAPAEPVPVHAPDPRAAVPELPELGQKLVVKAIPAPMPDVEGDEKPTPTRTPVKTASLRASAGRKAAADLPRSDHFDGRSGPAKAALLKLLGGTEESEAAVARGLLWLKNHQREDGSWSFVHNHSPDCDCSTPGLLMNCPTGATAMAILAFLGAGETHKQGAYQEEVRRGLQYLLDHGTRAEKGIRFNGNATGPPTFYAHALATMALSEALAMTGDARFRPSVEGGIAYLAATQHSAGGWRYYPGQPGDTSVTAWQVMALKSGQFSRILVPAKTLKAVERFLVSTQTKQGSRYAYTPRRKGNPTATMTAAGLLCRMYLGWKQESPALKNGVRFLDELGPATNDMYYNYYAAQVLHHWGGPEWKRWNPRMRDLLVQTQIKEGHAAGSWDLADPHGRMGGRLYMTTLAILTLEVYYRHLPLYQRDFIQLPLQGLPEGFDEPEGRPDDGADKDEERAAADEERAAADEE